MGSERASDLPKVTQQSEVQGQVHALFTALAEATHFSPKRQSWASVPYRLGGLRQDREQSLEIFIEGMDKTVPEALPGLGPVPSQSRDLSGGAKGSTWIYVISILRLASIPTRCGSAMCPDLRSRHEGCRFVSLSPPLCLDSKTST